MLKRTRTYEIVTYVIIWVLLFAAPVLTEAIRSLHADNSLAVEWSLVRHVWMAYLPFLVAFVLHDIVLAPRLVFRNQRLLYGCCLAVLTSVFVLYQCHQRPDMPHGHDRPVPADVPPAMHGQRPPLPPGGHLPMREPPAVIGQHDLMATIVLLLMLAMNLGVKFYVRQREDEQRMAERERHTLEQQLEYLKYQINPHFLMNTLNNIHALVDIDTAEAQKMIVDLSHLLRFVLYEGNKPRVPLAREIQFVRDYITLMRQRLSNSVEVTFDETATLSSNVSALVPPMLFITFVENAFKHGVSYKHPSYVHISVSLDGDRLHFACANSRRPEGDTDTPTGGLGLKNVRQRLDLLFADRYCLDITQTADTYSVQLDFPIELA